LVVSVIEAQVNARDAAVSMFDSLFIVNVDVEEAEENTFRETGVQGKLHPSFLLQWCEALV
jgi:hypothetical protein